MVNDGIRLNNFNPTLGREVMPECSGSLYVVQITDTHLFGPIGKELLGVDTNRTFLDVLDAVATLCPSPDVVLLTGDLSQDGSRESYRRLASYMKQLSCDSYWLPGNHDKIAPMYDSAKIDRANTQRAVREMSRAVQRETVLPAMHGQFNRAMVWGNWRFVMLNSQMPGKESGRLDDSALEFLARSLADASSHNQWVSVCLHHPPLSSGSRWLDTTLLQAPQRLLDCIDRFNCVKAVLFGHIHQEFSAIRHGVPFFGCPSTCFQFKPQSVNFALDTIAPGFRQLWFQADGSVVTNVVRVEAAMAVPDANAIGY